MTHHPLTKAEREELRAILDGKFEGNLDAVAVAFCVPRLLADLDAAEAERDALRQIAEGCCNATDGGCSPGVSIEFLRDVPSEVEHSKRERDRLRKMPQSAFEAATFRELNAMEAQRDRAESELDAERRMRVEDEAAWGPGESERATADASWWAERLDLPAKWPRWFYSTPLRGQPAGTWPEELRAPAVAAR